MDKKAINEIAKRINSSDVMNFLILRVNLNATEQKIALNRIRDGITQEQCAEKLHMSVRNFQRLDDKVYRKVGENWDTLDFLRKYLD